MSTTSLAVASSQIKPWKRMLQTDSSIANMAVDHQNPILQKMSDVLPSTIKIKEQDVIKQHQKNSFSSIRKQNMPPVTGLQSPAFDQRKRFSHRSHNSNIDASKLHQKLADLESQICVMKKQHLDMLEALHNEIESLKNKNKDLQFQLVMKDFDTNLSLKETDVIKDDASITIIKVRPDKEQIEELESRIKALEKELDCEKSRNKTLNESLIKQESKLNVTEDDKHKAIDESISNLVKSAKASKKEETLTSPISSNASTPTNSNRTDLHALNSFNNPNEHISSPIDIVSDIKGKHNEMVSKQVLTDPEENMDDYDEISFPDISASSMSTPTPPDEYVMKLQEAEVMIEKLRNTNRHHRTELTNIKSNLGRSAKLKFRGCNHPEQKRSQIIRTHSSHNDLTNSDILMNKDGLELIKSANHNAPSNNSHSNLPNTRIIEKRSLLMQPKGAPRKDGGFSMLGHKDISKIPKGNKKMFPRSESLEAFPPLTKKFSRRQQSRSPLRSGLPPVPGSSGSESSYSTSKSMSFNLVSLQPQNTSNKQFFTRKKKGYVGNYKTDFDPKSSKYRHVKPSGKITSLQRISAISELKQVEEKDNPS